MAESGGGRINQRVAGSSPATGAFLCSGANKSLLKIMSQAYYTYVLYSSKHDRLYVGQTAKLKDRLREHNSGQVRSTKSYIPWQLIHFEEYDTRAKAMAREKELKTHRGRDIIRDEVLSGRVRRRPD